ncbi:MAG TPA: hypothetical protein VEC76_14590 [Streptosporangiaceae bacterium]|nr:hypothetical protein [Streptosporangiaceae bacterium]
MRITWAAGTRTLASVAVAGLVAAGMAACGVSVGGPAASPAKTAAASAPASQAPAAQSSTPAAESSASDTPAKADASVAGKLPDYHPSTVVSDSGSSTVLKSPDSVSKIGAFYRNALASGGWVTTSSSMGSLHASFTAHRAHEGVSISVYPRFGGAGISISRYPV